MSVTPATSPTASANNSSSSKKTGAATGADDTKSSSNTLSGDFNTFLKLLTAQMKNQDPLQPMDSTAFVAQLASFSSVEQQIGSNTRLDKILNSLDGSGAQSLAGWIGREVRAPTSAAFSGKPIDVGVSPVDSATKAVLVVKNDFGREVSRSAVSPTATDVSWNGTDSNGNAVANGQYSFSLESYNGDTLLSTQTGQVFGKVTEARKNSDGDTVLVLDGGAEVKPSDITAVR